MRHTLLVFVFLALNIAVMAQDVVPLIPKPLKAVKQTTAFVLDRNTQIVAVEEVQGIAQYLQTALLKYQGIGLRNANKAKSNYIDLQLKPNAKQAQESYQLIIDENKIEIKASHMRGLFAGVSSLLQMIRQQQIVNQKITLPSWTIEDEPRYAWRGVMLDE